MMTEDVYLKKAVIFTITGWAMVPLILLIYPPLYNLIGSFNPGGNFWNYFAGYSIQIPHTIGFFFAALSFIKNTRKSPKNLKIIILALVCLIASFQGMAALLYGIYYTFFLPPYPSL